MKTKTHIKSMIAYLLIIMLLAGITGIAFADEETPDEPETTEETAEEAGTEDPDAEVPGTEETDAEATDTEGADTEEAETEENDIMAPEEPAALSFPDMPETHWAYAEVTALTEAGIIDGYEDGTYRPNNDVTRAEWAKIMIGAAGLPADDLSVLFTDAVEDQWYIPFINAAADYLPGYDDDSYHPNEAALREDVIVSMAMLKGYDVSAADDSCLDQFSDADTIADDARAYVALAVENGLIGGFNDGTIRPDATLNRAQAAIILWRAFMKDAPLGGSGDEADTDAEETDDSRYPDRDLVIMTDAGKKFVVFGELMQASLLTEFGINAALNVIDPTAFADIVAADASDAIICDMDTLDAINALFEEPVYVGIPCVENDGVIICIAAHIDAVGLQEVFEATLEAFLEAGADEFVLDNWDA
ncbi:MAG: S-layer homology domain-containing protein [Oscillospiraceae bacterium]|nr:S-layer homology domain-containing protein [Oscillospiraceae bacterium]